MAGVGLVVTLILYPNSDPAKSATNVPEDKDVEGGETIIEGTTRGAKDEIVGSSNATVTSESSISLEKRV